MAQFSGVLKNRNFFFLWAGQIISQFGDRLNQMALIALISSRAPGSTLQLAKVLSFTILPVFLVGPAAFFYVDRWNYRRTMLWCDLFRAALVAVLALSFIRCLSLWPIYIIIFLVFSLSRFFIPAKMAMIPQLVTPEKLLLANSLSSTTGMIAAVAGFGLGGFIVERIGATGGFLLDALSFLISGLFILLLSVKACSFFKQEAKPRLFSDIKEGLQYLTRDKLVRSVTQMSFLLWSALGAVYVVIIVFVQKTLGSVTRDLGFLAMLLGLGLFSGSLIYGRFGNRLSRLKMIFISLGISGIILTVFTICLSVFASTLLAMLLSFLLGVALSPVLISSQTLIHEAAEEKMRGRIFGLLEIVAHLAFLLFMLFSSFLAERIGRFWILLFVGIVLTLVGFGAAFSGASKEKLIKEADYA